MKLKIRIMNPKPQVSDEEIRSYMDFDGLLERRKSVVLRKQMKLWSGSLILALIVIVGAILLFPVENNSTQTTSLTDSTLSPPKQEAPGSVSDADNVDGVAGDKKPDAQVRADHPEAKGVEHAARDEKPNETASPTSGAASEAENSLSATDDIYLQAEPIEGYEALFEFFRENLKYPQDAIKDSIQGVMKISFVINEEGKPVNIRTEETLGKLFDAEAVKLIESMPPWKPALLNGKPVKSRISLPLTFEIRKVE